VSPTAAAVRAFEVTGPLPQGVTLLEASAGTGKTFTIAALVARYVAEGLPMDQLMVVTFTRMATGELKDRVRERLVSVAEGLARPGRAGDDEVLAVLAAGPPETVEERRRRVVRALAAFDSATIETTHGFCLHVLAGLGVAGDLDLGMTLVDDARDLLDDVIDDLYLRRFWRDRRPPPFRRAEAVEIGRQVLANPATRYVPEGLARANRSPPALRRRLADALGAEIERRKRAANLVTFDDLLVRLDRTLADEVRGPAAAARLRAQYKVALVDEFQDTDAIQWEIVRRVFAAPGSTLVLIGDPKQAIYAFRGADVHSYLAAAAVADRRATLSVNWRSDEGLIEAYDALFAGCQLGHPGIAYRPVRAARAEVDPPFAAALRVRLIDRRWIEGTAKGHARLGAARRKVAEDLAAEVVTLLEAPGGRADADAPRRPGDLAALVRTNAHAEMVREALDAAGVPAVTGAAGSVLATPAAAEWRSLLDALERPSSRERAGAVALTPFVGWTASRAARAEEAEWDDLHWRLHQWSATLRQHGVAALYHRVSTAEHLPERVLAQASGERMLTDLGHVAELLHGAAHEEGLGATALAGWLSRRIAEADEDGDDERSRRIDSDADAVQVLTIHRAKGLEFPVVLCPYLWDFGVHVPRFPVFHDPDRGGVRTLDLGGADGPDADVHRTLHIDEERGEDLRLLYVALTRARHRAVVWWAGTWDSRHSPLSRLLFSRRGEAIGSEGHRVPSDEEMRARLDALMVAAPRRLSVEWVREVAPRRLAPPGAERPVLEVGAFARHVDLRWRRSSYSAITRGVHEQLVASEPEDDVLFDDDVAEAGLPSGASGPGALLGLSAMPGGPRVGTVVHRVLEAVDFAEPDLPGALRRRLDQELAWSPVDVGDRATVAAGLATALRAPLGPLADGTRLCDVGRRHRLDELAFELPLAGGERPRGAVAVGQLADLLRAHLPATDPLAAYAARLEDPTLEGALRGFLTGSLDLVLRLEGPRFIVADYKTNRLGPPDAALSTWHYRPEALRAEMFRAHYPLQALFYTVALHRFLRWRLRGYLPARHLAGVLYLFVRGMSGPSLESADPDPPGVWSWRPPPALVEAASDLFDGTAVDGTAP
jgi:exodeoxyribonuclease V beta subunit